MKSVLTRTKIGLGVVAAILCLSGARTVIADDFLIGYGNPPYQTFGTQNLPNQQTYLTADFSSTTPGTVTLTLSSSLPATSGSNVYDSNLWAFTVDPTVFTTAADYQHLSITRVGGTAPTANPPNISQSSIYTAGLDGGGDFAFVISFPNVPSTNYASSFTGGNTAIFTITDSSLPSLKAANFDNGLSQGATDNGGQDVSSLANVAHYNLTTQTVDYFADLDGSNPDAVVPEPTGLIALSGLCGMGLIGLVWRRRSAA